MSSGIILDRRGLSVSKHGFVFTSIKLSLKFSSSIKSYPNISNELRRRLESNLKQVALIVSRMSLLIYGIICY